MFAEQPEVSRLRHRRRGLVQRRQIVLFVAAGALERDVERFFMTIYGRLPRKAIFLVSAAWNARIYPACCWSDRAPGLDGSPLLLAL